jgi:DNA polymerase
MSPGPAAVAPRAGAPSETEDLPEPPAFMDDAPPPDFDFAAPSDDLVESILEDDAPATSDAREFAIARMDWPALESAVRDCRACALGGTRRHAVFGVGDRQAKWMIIGEAPGAEEDARGEPFVGQAGQLLDAMLAALDMKRGEGVYIANVLKCRPPGNRNPEPQEVARCSPHLARQVALIRPRLLILMGRFAAHTMLSTDASIGSLRGRVHDCGGTPAIVTYHPAYLLRTPVDKAKSWEDLLLARATDRRLQDAAAAPISPSS